MVRQAVSTKSSRLALGYQMVSARVHAFHFVAHICSEGGGEGTADFSCTVIYDL